MIIRALPVILDVGSLESKETYEPFLHGVMQHGLIVRSGVSVLEELVNPRSTIRISRIWFEVWGYVLYAYSATARAGIRCGLF